MCWQFRMGGNGHRRFFIHFLSAVDLLELKNFGSGDGFE